MGKGNCSQNTALFPVLFFSFYHCEAWERSHSDCHFRGWRTKILYQLLFFSKTHSQCLLRSAFSPEPTFSCAICCSSSTSDWHFNSSISSWNWSCCFNFTSSNWARRVFLTDSTSEADAEAYSCRQGRNIKYFSHSVRIKEKIKPNPSSSTKFLRVHSQSSRSYSSAVYHHAEYRKKQVDKNRQEATRH